MKIVFMGTPEAASLSLQRLLDVGHEIVAVYTQPDRPSGRGNQIVHAPVKRLALDNGLAIRQPVKIRTEEAITTFRSHGADVAVVVAYGRILPAPFLGAFPLGAINVHFSLLPKYRGAAPVNWAIVNGEAETGVSTMKMDEGLDTGPILLQRSTPIGPDETAPELMARLAHLGADLMAETLERRNELRPTEQDHAGATFAPIMKKSDGLIDWGMAAADISNRVRGFQPFPSSYTFFGSKRLVIWKALPAQTGETNGSPGTVVDANSTGCLVRCGTGSALQVSEVQLEGKRRMSAVEFINGSRVEAGMIFGS